MYCNLFHDRKALKQTTKRKMISKKFKKSILLTVCLETKVNVKQSNAYFICKIKHYFEKILSKIINKNLIDEKKQFSK